MERRIIYAKAEFRLSSSRDRALSAFSLFGVGKLVLVEAETTSEYVRLAQCIVGLGVIGNSELLKIITGWLEWGGLESEIDAPGKLCSKCVEYMLL